MNSFQIGLSGMLFLTALSVSCARKYKSPQDHPSPDTRQTLESVKSVEESDTIPFVKYHLGSLIECKGRADQNVYCQYLSDRIVFMENRDEVQKTYRVSYDNACKYGNLPDKGNLA